MFKKAFAKHKNNIRIKQVVSLLSWNFLGIPLGMATSIIVTRFLGSKNYGDYMFINNIFNITILLANFGLLQAANRALVLTTEIKNAHEYYGAELVVLGGIYLVVIASLYIYTSLDPNIEAKGLRSSLIYVIPFAWVYLLMQYYEALFQADNKIELLVIARYYPRFGLFIAALIIYFFFKDYVGNKLFIIWGFFLSTQIIVYLYVLKKIKVSFSNLKKRIVEIFGFNKTFGFNVYVGNIFSTLFAQLTGLLISYFSSDNTGVGFYSLALTLVSPLSLIPNVIATTHYKEFSTLKQVPRKLLLITLSISVATLVILWLVIPPFIYFFYSKEFVAVIKLSFIVSIGVLFYGLSDFFSRFLGSHGDGKALRNSSFIVGFCILLFNVTLVPLWHETGAAVTYLIAGLVYLITILWYYRRFYAKTLQIDPVLH